MYLSFAWRYFRAKKSANAINIISWVTASVIAFATCCQVLVLSVFNGFEGLVKSLYASFYSDIKILPARGKTFVMTPAEIARLQKQPGIASYAMIVEEKALLQHNENQSALYLKGVDSNFSKMSGVPSKVVDGKFDLGTAESPGLVLGVGIQNAVAVNIDPSFGSPSLTLILPKKTDSPDALEALSEGNASATGVFAIQQDFDNQYALTNIDFVRQQMALGPDDFTAMEVNLSKGKDLDDAQEDLQKTLGANFKVLTRFQQNTSLYQTMQLEKWAIYAVLTLILLIAAFNMVSALTMLVLEKQMDIRVLQSMGADKNMIQKIFLSEGLLLGVIGAGAGILLAVIICLLQLRFHFVKLVGGSFLIDYFPVKLIITDFLLVAATAIGISFIASWFPAHKAAYQPLDLK
ncbi:MAG: FtsX-like permease family protein [Ferruginibacter sp.]